MNCRMLLSQRLNMNLSRQEELLEFILEYGDESAFANLRSHSDNANDCNFHRQLGKII